MIRTDYPAKIMSNTVSPISGMIAAIRRQSTTLLLALVLVLGIFLGRYSAGMFGSMVNDTAYRLVAGYSLGNVGQGIGQSFLAAFSASFSLLLILFFCAFCAIAAPIIFGTLLFYGIGLGLCYSLFFSLYRFDAFWYVVIILLPNSAITALTLIKASGLALKQSSHIFSRSFGDAPQNTAVSGKNTVVMFIGFTVLLTGNSLLYAITVVLFGVRFSPI